MDTQITLDAAKAEFARVFQLTDNLHVARAPGRVNLIGEHTDYNDGFVLPMAIDPQVWAVCRPREDSTVRMASTLFPGGFAQWSLDGKIEPGTPKWANYCRGVTAGLLATGIPLSGFDALLINTLPMGGGLSSSAAVEVATACCFLAVGGLDIDMQRLAAICQWAEHKYAGMPCGIMDQTAVISSKAGHAMLLDCRDLSKDFFPIDAHDVRVVIINSNVKHELTGSKYADRRRECSEGVARFRTRYGDRILALRDVTLDQVDESKALLGDVVYARCRHVVSENGRTMEAADLLGKKQYEQAGRLMFQSHESLRRDYQVSCEELDCLVEETMKVKGVYGARMTGGGFGGCIVALVQPRAVEAVIDTVGPLYKERFNRAPTAFVTSAAAGASILE
ncbi:MAG: galactokinase [Tepidisphaeraceae bacterium]|jgi:galactokinase